MVRSGVEPSNMRLDTSATEPVVVRAVFVLCSVAFERLVVLSEWGPWLKGCAYLRCFGLYGVGHFCRASRDMTRVAITSPYNGMDSRC